MNLEQLRNRKKELKITLQKISDLSGIPKRTVDCIFSGATTNPRIKTVEAIERALGLDKPAETPSATDTEAFEIVIKIILRGADDGR